MSAQKIKSVLPHQTGDNNTYLVTASRGQYTQSISIKHNPISIVNPCTDDKQTTNDTASTLREVNAVCLVLRHWGQHMCNTVPATWEVLTGERYRADDRYQSGEQYQADEQPREQYQADEGYHVGVQQTQCYTGEPMVPCAHRAW